MEKLGVFFAAIGVLIIMAVLLAWPTQLLWNYCLTPAVESLNIIGFWQALGINMLCGILFRNSNQTSNSK